MRMWNIDPKLLCKKHLNGEHFETHLTSGGLEKRKTVELIRTLCSQGMMDLRLLTERHDALATEMLRRGGNHKSDMWFEPELYIRSLELPTGFVDADESMRELWSRCPNCRERMQEAGIEVDLDELPGEFGPNGEFRLQGERK